MNECGIYSIIFETSPNDCDPFVASTVLMMTTVLYRTQNSELGTVLLYCTTERTHVQCFLCRNHVTLLQNLA